MSGALRKLEFGEQVLRRYWREMVDPVLEAGFAPPLLGGFDDYLLRASRLDPRVVGGDAPAPAASPYDSHPPTPARLAALAALAPAGEVDPGGDLVATSLLSQLPALERTLLERIRPGTVLRPMPWARATDDVFLPLWRAAMRRYEALLTGAGLGNLVEWARAAANVGHRARVGSKGRLTDAQAGVVGVVLLARALTLALAAQGWSVAVLPSAPITCRRGTAAIAPYETVERMAAGTLDAEEWARMRGQLGIADASLAAVVAGK